MTTNVALLPEKWRKEVVDDITSTSLWDQGYAHGRNECADELTAALAHRQDGELLALAEMMGRVAQFSMENNCVITPEGLSNYAERCRALAASPRGVEAMEYEYEVFQNDEWQAGGSTTTLESAFAECSHYAMMYGQDGPVEVRYYAKRRVSESEVAAALQPDSEEVG